MRYRLSNTTRELLASASARLLVMPISGAASILTARLITETLGVDTYGLFALCMSVFLLFPFADLGSGAALTNASSTIETHPGRFLSVLRRALILTSSMGTVFVVSCLLLAIGGAWPRLLGLTTDELNWPIAIGIAFFGLAIPGGLGISMLVGLGRNGVSVVMQGLVPVLTLAFVALALALGSPPSGVLVFTGVSYAVANWLCFLIALSRNEVRRARRAGHTNPNLQRAADGSTSFRQTALPMILIMSGSALTFQVGRLSLAHTSTLTDVATYAAVWLSFQPVFSVIQVASRSLWPRFAVARATGAGAPAIYREAMLVNVGLGAVGAGGFITLGPLISSLGVGNTLALPITTYLLLGAVILVQACYQPSAMYLTDPAGLRFQAATTLGTALAVSLLTVPLGAAFQGAGVALALLTGVLLFQAIPCFLYAKRRMR